MMLYSIEARTRKYVKEYEFFSLARKYKKTIIGYRAICFQIIVHKAGEFARNKITDAALLKTLATQTMVSEVKRW